MRKPFSLATCCTFEIYLMEWRTVLLWTLGGAQLSLEIVLFQVWEWSAPIPNILVSYMQAEGGNYRKLALCLPLTSRSYVSVRDKRLSSFVSNVRQLKWVQVSHLGQFPALNPKEKPVPREFGKAGRFTPINSVSSNLFAMWAGISWLPGCHSTRCIQTLRATELDIPIYSDWC